MDSYEIFNSDSCQYALYKYLSFIHKNYNLYVYNAPNDAFILVSKVSRDYYIDFDCHHLSYDTVLDDYQLIGNILIRFRDISKFLNNTNISEECFYHYTLLRSKNIYPDFNLMNIYMKHGDIGPIFNGCSILYEINNSTKITNNSIKSNGGDGMSISNVLGLKMVMSIINGKGELDLSKLLIAQSISKGESIEVSEIMKTKMMESLMKDSKSKDDLPLEKLMIVNMLEDGNIDLNQLIQYKMMNSMLSDDSNIDLYKMMMMQCMTNGGDVSDIIKYKMMSKLFDEDVNK